MNCVENQAKEGRAKRIKSKEKSVQRTWWKVWTTCNWSPGKGERMGFKGKQTGKDNNESMAKNFTKLMKDFQSSDSVLSFDLGADYVSVYNLWKFIEWHTHDLCTFLVHMLYFNKIFFKNLSELNHIQNSLNQKRKCDFVKTEL